MDEVLENKIYESSKEELEKTIQSGKQMNASETVDAISNAIVSAFRVYSEGHQK